MLSRLALSRHCAHSVRNTSQQVLRHINFHPLPSIPISSLTLSTRPCSFSPTFSSSSSGHTRSFHSTKQPSQQHQQSHEQSNSNSHEQSHQHSDSHSNSSHSHSHSHSHTKQSAWKRFMDKLKQFGAWYSRVLEEHPYKTQMVTSGFLGGIADVTTQYLEQGWAIEDGEEPHPWDWRRLAAVTSFGIFLMGPVGHIWYQQLERFTHAFCKSTGSMIFAKVCGDTFLFGPVALASFFAVVSWLEGEASKDIYAKLRRDFVPTYIVDYSMWPIVQGLNFYFVPVRHQLLCVNTVCYFDDVFLSYVQHNGIPKIFEIIEDAWADYLDDPDEMEHGTKAKARKAEAAAKLEREKTVAITSTPTALAITPATSKATAAS